MIDNIRFRIHNPTSFENNLLKSKTVDLYTTTNIFTNKDEEYPKKGKYYNMEISVNRESAYLTGSIHKLYNLMLYDENQNYNNFSHDCAIDVVQHLVDLLKINPKATTLTNLELGFNIPLSINPAQFLDYHVLMYDFESPSKNLKFGGKGDYKEFQKTDYYFKIYNKSKPYNLDTHILRVELKIKTKRLLHKLGVHSLADIGCKRVIENIYSLLWRELQNVTIIDDFSLTEMSPEDRSCLSHYTNPNYWMLLARDASYKVRGTKKKHFQQLIQKHGLNKLRNEVLDKIATHFTYLLESPCNELKIAA